MNSKGKDLDKAYRSKSFKTDAERSEYLFQLYEKYTADLLTTDKNKEEEKVKIKHFLNIFVSMIKYC